MRIVLTGGGSGGHFYPIIAVAEALREEADRRHISPLDLYFISDQKYDERALFDNRIQFIKIPTGKLRRYFSISNFTDIFKTFFGTIRSIFTIFKIYPDVIFGKGGSPSFPILFAARILKIPVVIHETDAFPGRTNAWASKFASRIAISYPETAEFFPDGKTELTGNPIRKALHAKISSGANEYLHLEPEIPMILVLGGSLGSQIINNALLDALPTLVEKYQIIHQCGKANFNDVSERSKVILEKSLKKERYRVFEFLNSEALMMASGRANLVITRAGGTLFEVALLEIPAIVIPITDSNGDHQRKNAYSYARHGAGVVIEEANLSPHILVSEISRILDKPEIRASMSEGARRFAKPDASKRIASIILNLALEHEK